MMRTESYPAMASWRMCWLEANIVRPHISVVKHKEKSKMDSTNANIKLFIATIFFITFLVLSIIPSDVLLKSIGISGSLTTLFLAFKGASS
jgi:hypothetical protein